MSDRSKPTVHDLGVDVDALTWRRSGDSATDLEVAFAGEWILVRAGGGQVLVFDHAEWDAFVRGARGREFDDAATPDGG
ncbi:MAG: DUF397 domain-containing protein [Streptosporangiales bacterium]|nr:DUF397 domain-containing protein [Streptosporangiales bacterium]